MTVVSSHHKPTPTINNLGLAATDQTMIYHSLQINKSIAIHCESPCSSAQGRTDVSDRLHYTEGATSLTLQGLHSTHRQLRLSAGRQQGGIPHSLHFTDEKNQGHKPTQLSQCAKKATPTPLGAELSSQGACHPPETRGLPGTDRI